MYLKKISFKNFRCFRDLEVDLPQKDVVLIGKNGTGKTSFLQGICYGLVEFVEILSGTGYEVPDLSKLSEEAWRHVARKSFGFVTIPQYPVTVKLSFSIFGEDHSSFCSTGIAKGLLGDAGNLGLRQLALQWRNQAEQWDEKLVLPVVAFYGVERQWHSSSERNETLLLMNQGRFPRPAGYRAALNAKVDIDGIRTWFQKMILMERRRPEPIFDAVKQAMARFLEILFGEVNDALKIVVDYDAEVSDIDLQISHGEKVEVMPLFRMSDGVKSVLSMAADIAYRMAVINPQLGERVLEGTPGIVIIDEVDLHLHPAWQKNIIRSFSEVFPKVQFIYTTHAPAVLTNIQAEHILTMSDGNVYPLSKDTYGKDVDVILRDIMGAQVRPSVVMNTLSAFHKAIDDNDLNKAKNILETLKKTLGENDEDVIRAQVTLDLENMEIQEG